MTRYHILFAVALLAVCFCSCRKYEEPDAPYTSWKSRGLYAAETPVPEPLRLPPAGAFIWGGTVSHHLFAFSYIDRWFAELAERQSPDVFIILSPSHFDIQTEQVSLTTRPWSAGDATVQIDKRLTKKLLKQFDVDEDKSAFTGEHGVSTLVPFIAEYFPSASIVPVIYKGEYPVRVDFMKKLYSGIYNVYKENGKECFILVSSDFSHHAGRTVTERKDQKSWKFFNQPKNSGWIHVICDNHPGMYVLSQFVSQIPDSSAVVLWHTNSSEISGSDSPDITSYFFSFFYSSE